MFWWLIIKYRFFLTTSDNVLTWKGATLITSMMVGYDVNIATIIWHKIHDRVFWEKTNLYFFILFRDCVMIPIYQRFQDLTRK